MRSSSSLARSQLTPPPARTCVKLAGPAVKPAQLRAEASCPPMATSQSEHAIAAVRERTLIRVRALSAAVHQLETHGAGPPGRHEPNVRASAFGRHVEAVRDAEAAAHPIAVAWRTVSEDGAHADFGQEASEGPYRFALGLRDRNRAGAMGRALTVSDESAGTRQHQGGYCGSQTEPNAAAGGAFETKP